ncbi:MAG: D-glycerate dehydrogenase [Candidatus Paceibacterota bacterium]|jgi:glyoxylate reductase
MKKIFITREIPEVGIDMLRKAGFEVVIRMEDSVPSERDLARELSRGGYDGVISLLTDPISAKIFDAAPSVKIYANYAAGYNNIDIEGAKKRGVTIANTAGVSGTAVAEHTIALIFALTTRLVEGDAFVRKGKYKGWSPMAFMGTDLHGKTIGLIGAGNIGAEVARALRHGFGAEVIYYDIKRNEALERECGATWRDSVEAVLRESDIVSLHVPLLPSTHHLIDASRLALMKRSAFLVNTSRGPIIDEEALVSALKAGTIRGAGLDVFEFEPRLARGLAGLPNTVLTPHIASSRQSVRDEMSRSVAESIIDFFSGKEPKNKVA